MELEYFDEFLNRLEEDLSEIHGTLIAKKNVYDALLMMFGDSFYIEYPLDIRDIEISYGQAFNALTNFDFSIFSDQIESELEFDRDILFRTKAKIKAAGYQIVVHRYDKDPFPSNPHGHILDQNLKIDLSNGKCYRNRKEITSIGRKQLVELREKIRLKYKGELPPLQS